MGLRHRGNQQDVCNLTETNSVDDGKLDAFVAHAESIKETAAWELNSFQQAIDEKTGRYIQFISDRSFRPLQIYRNPISATGNISTIAGQTEDQEMVFLEEGRKRDGRMLWIGIILAMLTLCFCLAVYMKMRV